MKKKIFNIFMLVAATVALASCSDDDSEGKTYIVDYPKLEIQGDVFYILPIGQPYYDDGCTATFQGEDYTSHIVAEGIEDVDENVPGLYEITYTAVGPNGYAWSETRTVAVCDPSIDTDLSGTWTTTSNTYRDVAGNQAAYPKCTTTIKYLCPGIFEIKDYLAGFYSQFYGYGAAYPGYDFDVEGIIQLTGDNKIIYVSGGPATAFGGDVPSDFQDGVYDPATGTISYVVTWSDMDFHVELQK